MPHPTFYAYLGGSFDPVHFGHLSMLTAVQQSLALAKNHGKITQFECQLIPTKANPFKHNQTPPQHRLAMLNLLAQHSPLIINPIEINDNGDLPSYTINTLDSLTAQHPKDYHCLIMGLDSLLSFPTWRAWERILTMANLWVFDRQLDHQPNPQTDKPSSLKAQLSHLPPQIADNLSFNTDAFFAKVIAQKAGAILLDDTPIKAISSTQIRQTIAQNGTIDDFVPSVVQAYIAQHQLYRQ